MGADKPEFLFEDGHREKNEVKTVNVIAENRTFPVIVGKDPRIYVVRILNLN